MVRGRFRVRIEILKIPGFKDSLDTSFSRSIPRFPIPGFKDSLNYITEDKKNNYNNSAKNETMLVPVRFTLAQYFFAHSNYCNKLIKLKTFSNWSAKGKFGIHYSVF